MNSGQDHNVGTAKVAAWVPWVMWGLGAVFYCYGFFQRVTPSVMVSDLMRDLAVSATLLGNLSAFYFYAYASLQLPVGVMVDRWGPRRMLTIAAALAAAGSLLFASAEDVYTAYAGRLLIGAGAGFSWVSALKLAAVWFPPHRFALLTGLTMMLGMAGAVGGQAPVAALVATVGWRGTMTGAGIFALGLSLVVWLVVRDRRTAQEESLSTMESGLLAGLMDTARRRQTWVIALTSAAMTATMLSFGGLWGVPYLMEAFDLERPVAAATTSLMLIGWAVGAPLSGWWSDHVKSRRRPMMLGAGLGFVTFAAIIYAPGLPLIVVQALMFINGVGSGAMIVGFATAREHNRAEASGATVALVNTCVMGMGAIYQPLLGWLLDLNWGGVMDDGARVYSVETYQSAFVALVLCTLVSFIAAAMISETHCRTVDAAK